MVESENPFPVKGYHGADLFCDREMETKKLINNMRGGLNTTMLSIRRMGKTGLIYHLFAELTKKSGTYCIYTDMYATLNIKDFTDTLGAAVLKAFPEKNPIGKKFMQLIKNFRPLISFDSLTGEPELTFDFKQPKQYERSLADIFTFLENQGKKIVIAMDEFQQITEYPEKNMEALLRSLIQPLKNITFIFSGSSKHLLHDMFNDSKRPFFASVQTLHLEPIEKEKYISFVLAKFSGYKRKINRDALEFIMEWTKQHTFYVQVICNRLFTKGEKNISLVVVQQECYELLLEMEYIFFQYRQLLSSLQWNLLKAISAEDKVYQPSAKKFLAKHSVGTPANVQRLLEALMSKEMIYKEQDNKGSYYRVYDCFLSRWLENKYK